MSVSFVQYFPHPLDAEKVSHLLGINSVDLIKSLIKPRIRVGTEYVQQGRNMEQVVYSIGALSKSLYERMFSWLVKRVNKTLDTKASLLAHFFLPRFVSLAVLYFQWHKKIFFMGVEGWGSNFF